MRISTFLLAAAVLRGSTTFAHPYHRFTNGTEAASGKARHCHHSVQADSGQSTGLYTAAKQTGSVAAFPSSASAETPSVVPLQVVATSAASPSSSVVAAAAAAAVSTATGDEPEFVKMHNAVRVKYGASDVTWNSTLANYASTYAAKCLGSHSGGPYGENLAFSAGYADAIATGINGWANEASSYSWSSPGFSESTGHFTQMVWKATTSIGCAHVKCPGGTFFPKTTEVNDNVVCEYYPPGNYAGEYQANVGELVA